MLGRVIWRRSSAFQALKSMVGARDRSIETQTQALEEQFHRLTVDNEKTVHLALNRLLPVQEQRVAMLVKELTQLNPFEVRALFAVLEEQRRKGFWTVNGKLTHMDDPMKTGDEWPFNHPRNLEFQAEAGLNGQLGLHGLPKAFVEKIESGQAFQSLDQVEVAVSAPAAEEKKPAEVKEEKTSFNLMLKGFAADGKLKVIKEVKTVLNLGLKEAKDKVESTAKEPVLLFKNVSKEAVKAAYEKLVAAGATLEWE